jgi:membrane protease subunit HflC
MTKSLLWVGIGVVALLMAFASGFTVVENEQVIITRFGKIVRGPIADPGLHFKQPFVDDVLRFDKRWMEWDGEPNQIPTRDKKYIWVDTYARWRISDPIRFYQRLRDEGAAQSRLDDIIDGEIRNTIASHELIEIVRTSSREFEKGDDNQDRVINPAEFAVQFGRDELTRIVLRKASAITPDYGIELADVQVKRINYVESVQVKVFERMISERKQIAEKSRSEGQGKSAEIRGKIEKELKTIESEAYRKAEEIRGRGDAEAAAIYAAAYNKDSGFYQFTKTLETYETTIDKETSVVLSTDNQVFKYLRGDKESAR